LTRYQNSSAIARSTTKAAHMSATLKTASGLDNVIAAETVLSMVDGEAGQLVIHGHRLEDIADRSFEWLLSELWRDVVPGNWREADVRRDLGHARVRAFAMLTPLLPEATRMPPMSALRLFAASVPDDETNPELHLVGTIAVGLGAAVRGNAGAAPLAPDATLPHAADLLRMITGQAPSEAHYKALETYLVSAMDHGLNASTFTARVVASTRARLPAAVTAALCAFAGPLHGGAPGPVLDMLDAIGSPDNAECWLDAAVARGDRLMGFGHRVYRVRDPRLEVVKPAVKRLGPGTGRLAYAEAVEKAALTILARRKPTRPLQTNLEFYAALLLEALAVPRDAFTGVFAAARVVGWIAHVHEQMQNGRIIRPQSTYIGPHPAVH
jgi:citrate synthase